MVDNIVNELTRMGLSEYESRAYIALLDDGKALTAYELAKNANLPTSKIYEVLAKLEEKQMVQALDESGKKKYAPQNFEEFLSSFRQDMNSTLQKVKFEFESRKTGSGIAAVWNLSDRESFIQKAKRMVEEAGKEILISGYRAEYLELKKELEKAAASGVKIAGIHFGPMENLPGRIYPHPIEDTLYSEKVGRGFVMVCDSREAVNVTIPETGKTSGAWSMNRGFVILAEDYIKHDIYIMKIVERMDADLIKRFGKNYYKLRDVFTDDEIGL